MNKLSNREAGYIAGIMDGEGSISILTRKPLPSNKFRLYYRPVIRISNTSRELLEYIKRICGVGWVGINNKNGGHRSTSYDFQLGKKNEILSFLLQIEDDLFLKKEQAQLMIAFINSRGLEQFHPRKGIKRGVDKQAYTKDELYIIEKLHQLHMKIRTGTKRMGPVLSSINQEYIQTVNSLPSIG